MNRHIPLQIKAIEKPLELTTTLDKAVGYGYRALPDGTVVRLDNLRKVMVIVQSDGVGGWVIRTAFPVP